LGRLKRGWFVGLGVAQCAPYWLVQNCPAPSAASCSRMDVRTCQFEPDGRYSVTASPDMLALEVSFVTRQAGDSDGTIPFQKIRSPTRPCASVESQCTCEHGLASGTLQRLGTPSVWSGSGRLRPVAIAFGQRRFSVAVGAEHNVCSPISNGIGSDKTLTLHPLFVDSSNHLRGFYSPKGSNLIESHWSNRWLIH